MTALRTILAHAIDYAGLFPPAALDLKTTLTQYREYARGEDAWALGRLILPAKDLAAAADSQLLEKSSPLSVLLGPELETDIPLVGRSRLRIESFECKVQNTVEIAKLAGALPASADIFFEVNVDRADQALLQAVSDAEGKVKIRTGGLTAESVPSAAAIARVLQRCADLRLPFKATAGLHHPLRSSQPLTYAEDAPVAQMHGFVNVFTAAALLFHGVMSQEEACTVLEDGDAVHFSPAANELCWRDKTLSRRQIDEVRANFMLSFGSCSFVEPLADSRSLGWL